MPSIRPLLLCVGFYPANAEQVCKPNSVLRLLEVAIIHLVQPLPAGSSDLPGGRSGSKSASGGQPWFDASLFGLAPRGVCLAAHVTTRAGALLPHHFTHHLTIYDRRGWFVFCCTCRRPQCQISQFSTADAPPLAGSLPYGVRTFLLPFPASDCPTDLAARLPKYNKKC